jgi:hypothetical protein
MNRTQSGQVSLPVRFARRLPIGTGLALSLGGRLAGGAAAAALAIDQSYEGTRTVAGVLAALAVLSCLPVSGRLRDALGWIGAGILFFGGAVLASFASGLLMVFCGVLAAIGVAIDEQQRGRVTSVLALFAGFGLTLVLVVVTVFRLEG